MCPVNLYVSTLHSLCCNINSVYRYFAVKHFSSVYVDILMCIKNIVSYTIKRVSDDIIVPK